MTTFTHQLLASKTSIQEVRKSENASSNNPAAVSRMARTR